MEDIRIERVITSPQYVQAAMLIGEQRALLSEKKPSWKRERQLLESHYRAPNGYLLLAKLGSEPVGVVALQRANDARLEAKRMYVRGKARGRGIDRRLVKAAADLAERFSMQLHLRPSPATP